MTGWVKYFFVGLLLTGIPGSFLALRSASEPQVLSEEVEIMAVETPSPSPTPTPTEEPTPTPKPTPTPTPSPSPSAKPLPPAPSQEEIQGFIERFAVQYGVDANVLRHIAICESGLNPLAYKAGYAGLYQFGPITWGNFRRPMGESEDPDLRYNAEEAVQTAAYVLSLGRESIWKNCLP